MAEENPSTEPSAPQTEEQIVEPTGEAKKAKAAPKKKVVADAAPAAPSAEGTPEEAQAASTEAPATPAVPVAATEVKPKAVKAKGTKGKKEAAASAAPAPISISLDDAIEPIKIVKAKGSKNIIQGVAHVQASFNNTIVSITDLRGSVIGWSSAGKCGFKGSRKSTAYAAQMVAQDACRQAMGHGLKEVEVRVKGPGAGRESAVRAMQAIGLDVSMIRDVTPVPHNGCRPPKQRRV